MTRKNLAKTFCYAFLLLMPLEAKAFEVTANIKATIVSDLGQNPTVMCYLYVLGREETQPQREEYAAVPATISGNNLTCSPKVYFSFSEIGLGAQVKNKVVFKVNIQSASAQRFRSITPYYGPKIIPQFSTTIDLTNQGIKF